MTFTDDDWTNVKAFYAGQGFTIPLMGKSTSLWAILARLAAAEKYIEMNAFPDQEYYRAWMKAAGKEWAGR